MGQTKNYPPAKLIAAVSVSQRELWPELQQKLEELWSPIDRAMDWYAFHHTGYYEEEMGAGLIKRMLAFRDPVALNILPEVKLRSNALEAEFLNEQGRRQVNIDPGYLTAAKLVLATTKNFAHRIYLDRGIFGDLHLSYRDGCFRPLEWTYADYREPAVLAFFQEVRQGYLTQLAEQGLQRPRGQL